MGQRVAIFGLQGLLFFSSPFLVWQGFVWIYQPKPIVFAAPLDALATLWGPQSALLWGALGQSLAVLFWAIPMAFAAGLGLALILSLFHHARGLLLPALVGIFAMPIYALNRALFSVMQLGFGTKVAVAALILYFPILIAALIGLRTIDPAVIEAAKLDGASRWAILRHIMVPLAGPAVAGGLLAAGAVAPLALFAAEQTGSAGGLGQLIRSQFVQNIDLAFAGVALLILIGLTLFALADGARRVMSRHAPDSFTLLNKT